MPVGVVDEVGHDPLQQSCVGGHHGQVVCYPVHDRVQLSVDEDPGDDLVEGDGFQADDEGLGFEAAEVQQVRDQVGEPIGAVLDRGEQLIAVRGGEVDVGLAKGGDGCLDAGEWGAKVVPDGGQECGAHGVHLGEHPGAFGFAGQSAHVHGAASGVGEVSQESAVLGEQFAAGADQDPVTAGRNLEGDGVLRVRPHSRQHRLLFALDQGDRGQLEGCGHLGEHVFRRSPGEGFAHRSAEHVGLRLASRARRLSAGGNIHQNTDGDGDHEEHEQGDDAVATFDDEGVVRRCEEEVRQQEGTNRGGNPRDEPAHRGDRNDREQVQQQHAS